MVIAEIVWTLESYYELDKKSDDDARNLEYGRVGSDSDLILQAIVHYTDKNVDFIDAFNAAWMVKNDVDKIYFRSKHFNRFEGIGGTAQIVSPSRQADSHTPMSTAPASLRVGCPPNPTTPMTLNPQNNFKRICPQGLAGRCPEDRGHPHLSTWAV